MYRIIISNQIKKSIKKLDKPVIKILLSVLEEIAENPYTGESLTGNLFNLKKRSFSHIGIEYRVVYQIYENRIEVQIIHVGSRENFYNELKRRI